MYVQVQPPALYNLPIYILYKIKVTKIQRLDVVAWLLCCLDSPFILSEATAVHKIPRVVRRAHIHLYPTYPEEVILYLS